VFYFWDTLHLTMPGSVLLAEVTESLLLGTYLGQDKQKKRYHL
jgi:hypothetical protein